MRREEAKQTRRMLAHRKARSQQVAAEEEESENARLKAEVASLTLRLADRDQQLHGQPKQETTQQASSSFKPKKKLNFCFHCGKDGHMAWNCKNDPNPTLVSKRFKSFNEDKKSEN